LPLPVVPAIKSFERTGSMILKMSRSWIMAAHVFRIAISMMAVARAPLAVSNFGGSAGAGIIHLLICPEWLRAAPVVFRPLANRIAAKKSDWLWNHNHASFSLLSSTRSHPAPAWRLKIFKQ